MARSTVRPHTTENGIERENEQLEIKWRNFLSISFSFRTDSATAGALDTLDEAVGDADDERDHENGNEPILE
jgi:hypothetical protein